MNLRPRRKRKPVVNVTSLIDVVLLLLIFFMVSTTFDKQGLIRVDLPEASGQPRPPEEKTRIEVKVDQQGNYFVNDAAVPPGDLAALTGAIVQVAGERRDLPFSISADGQASHQAVIRVMDAASQLGFTRMSFPTTIPAGMQ